MTLSFQTEPFAICSYYLLCLAKWSICGHWTFYSHVQAWLFKNPCFKRDSCRVLVGWGCQRLHEIIHSFKCGLVFFIRPFCTEYTLFMTLSDQIYPKVSVSFREKFVNVRNHFFNNWPKISTFGPIKMNLRLDLHFFPFHSPAVLPEWHFCQKKETTFYW